jgi:hypothetical protein
VDESPYRELPPAAPDPYTVGWNELRRRRRLRWIAFFGWLPVAAVGASVLHFPLIAVPLVLLAFGATIYAALFVCPKCGKPFERRSMYGNPWTQHCLNCGIRRGTPKGSTPP